MLKMIPLYSVSSRSEIERRAHEIFEAAGCPADHDLDHWLQAESEHLSASACVAERAEPAELRPV